jgi:hypothetical protein
MAPVRVRWPLDGNRSRLDLINYTYSSESQLSYFGTKLRIAGEWEVLQEWLSMATPHPHPVSLISLGNRVG